MIKELTWDSAFFRRKIGTLILPSRNSSHSIEKALEKASKKGFAYLTCRLKYQDTALIRLLESYGFYLSDIGVILAMKTETFKSEYSCIIAGQKEGEVIHPHPPLKKGGRGDFHLKYGEKDSLPSGYIKKATERDIPMLKRMSRSLFPESRFYSDPFFSKDEADGLYQTWIENSVKGEAADTVFCIPRKGFITCRKSGRRSGQIVVIGITRAFRGKGLGTALVKEAMQWFADRKIAEVTVRTQLKNLSALSFYLRLGFLPKEYDLVFGKIV
jgi:GNAT superfamily N-acetyltransferase